MGARSTPRTNAGKFFRNSAFFSVDGKKKPINIPNGTAKARRDSVQKNKV